MSFENWLLSRKNAELVGLKKLKLFVQTNFGLLRGRFVAFWLVPFKTWFVQAVSRSNSIELCAWRNGKNFSSGCHRACWKLQSVGNRNRIFTNFSINYRNEFLIQLPEECGIILFELRFPLKDSTNSLDSNSSFILSCWKLDCQTGKISWGEWNNRIVCSSSHKLRAQPRKPNFNLILVSIPPSAWCQAIKISTKQQLCFSNSQFSKQTINLQLLQAVKT